MALATQEIVDVVGRCQPVRMLQELRRRRRGSPGARSFRSDIERRGDSLVGLARAAGKMPGPLLRVVDDERKPRVELSLFDRPEHRVCGRRKQGVREDDPALRDSEDIGVDSTGDRRWICQPLEQRERGPGARSCNLNDVQGRPRQLGETVVNELVKPARYRELVPGENWPTLQGTAELEREEWIALRELVKSSEHRARERLSEAAVEDPVQGAKAER